MAPAIGSRRGRPRAAVSEDTVLNDRRERDRKKQQVKRSRVATQLAERDAEIERLHDIIGDLSNIFIKANDHLISRGDPGDVGTSEDNIAQLTKKFVAKAQEADTEDGTEKQLESPEKSSIQGRRVSSSEDTSSTLISTSEGSDTDQLMQGYTGHVPGTSNSFWNPRFDYGLLWASSASPMSWQGRNIEAEIQAGMDSFAARLMYSLVMNAREQLQVEEGPQPAPPIRMFRLTRRHEPTSITKWRIIECCRRLYQQATPMTPMTAEQHEHEKRSAKVIEGHCERDYHHELEQDCGRNLQMFEIEEYLRQVWAIDIGTTTIKRKQVQFGANGRAAVCETKAQDSTKLISQIVLACICFGTGPRFPKRCVDNCVQSFTW